MNINILLNPFFILFFISLVKPFPIEYFGVFGVRIFELIPSILITIYLWKTQQLAINSFLKNLIIWVLMFTAFYIVAVLVNLDKNTWLSISELLRYFLVLPYAFLGASWARNSDFKETFISSIWIVSLVIVGLGICQVIFNGTWLDSLFATQERLNQFRVHRRAIGVFWNPNIFAFVLLCFLSVSLFFKPKRIILVILLLVGIFLSGSRSGVGVAVITMIYFSLTKWKAKPWLYIVILTGGGVLWWLNKIAKTLPCFDGTPIARMIDGIQYINNLSQSTSMYGRFQHWDTIFSHFFNSPFLGNGPMRGYLSSVADNYYLYLLIHNGLVGIVLYCVLIGYFVWMGMFLIKIEELEKITFSLILSVCLLNLVSEAFIILPVLQLFFLWYGVLSVFSDEALKSNCSKSAINL